LRAVTLDKDMTTKGKFSSRELLSRPGEDGTNTWLKISFAGNKNVTTKILKFFSNKSVTEVQANFSNCLFVLLNIPSFDIHLLQLLSTDRLIMNRLLTL
jgi:hypothetical protein